MKRKLLATSLLACLAATSSWQSGMAKNWPMFGQNVGNTADGAGENILSPKNVAGLMRTKDISFFIDFHAYSRDVLFAWGIEANQSSDVAMNFTNSIWDPSKRRVKWVPPVPANSPFE